MIVINSLWFLFLIIYVVIDSKLMKKYHNILANVNDIRNDIMLNNNYTSEKIHQYEKLHEIFLSYAKKM